MADFNDSKKLYYQELIMKQEGRKWVEYYSILSGTSWLFTGRHNRGQQITDGIIIEVEADTFCAYAEKTCYRFPFWVQMGKQKYNFKCETKLQRYKWMFAIRLCASRSPPQPIPTSLPTGGGSVRIRNGTRKGTGSLKIPSSTDIRRASNPNLTLTRTQSCESKRTLLDTHCDKIDNIWDDKKISISALLQDGDPSSSKTLSVGESGLGEPNTRNMNTRRTINLGSRDYQVKVSESHNDDENFHDVQKESMKEVEEGSLNDKPQIEITQVDGDSDCETDTLSKSSNLSSPRHHMKRFSNAGKAAANRFLMTTGIRKSKSFTDGLNIDDKELDVFVDSFIEKEEIAIPMMIINPVVLPHEKGTSKTSKHSKTSKKNHGNDKSSVKRALSLLAHNSSATLFHMHAGGACVKDPPATSQPPEEVEQDTFSSKMAPTEVFVSTQGDEIEVFKKTQSLTSLRITKNSLPESPRRENSEPSLVHYAISNDTPALILNGLKTTWVR